MGKQNGAATSDAVAKQIMGQMKLHACECGGSRFTQSTDIIVLIDRFNPKMVGTSQVMEITCKKCGAIYDILPTGIQKHETAPEPPAGGIVNG